MRASEFVIERECKWHISPSGRKTNMCPDDDDYEINYGKNAADVEEGWKDWVAGAALGAAALGAQAKAPIVQQYVEPGDTIYSIARQNNVDRKDRKINPYGQH